VPERTCVACRNTQPEQAKQPKRNLVRLVRSPQGVVSIDPTGKQAGRGAYLCANPRCWQIALSKSALDRALHVTLSGADRAALEAYAAALAGEEPAH
jgi:predicted RNA-binding protein YlxR (DUF448 family)